MPSTHPKVHNVHPKLIPIVEESPKTLRSTARRTPSFSSSHSWDSSLRSSSFSSIEEFPTFSPKTPLNLKGIPFSWEQTPGIPKRQRSANKDSPRQLLPLPPAKKWYKLEEITPKKCHKKDPFYAALLECSKDDDTYFGGILKGSSTSKVARSLSDRFGFINMYANYSCKNTCAVSEAMVYVPRSNYSSDSLINRRSS